MFEQDYATNPCDRGKNTKIAKVKDCKDLANGYPGIGDVTAPYVQEK